MKESLIASDATTTCSLRDSKADTVGSEAVAIGVGGAVSSANTLSLLILKTNVKETTAEIKNEMLLIENPEPVLKLDLIF